MVRYVVLILCSFLFTGNSPAMTPLDIPFGVLLSSPNVGITQLSGTNTQVAWSFVADGSKQINSVRFSVSAVSGSLDSDDIDVHIYSNDTTTGKPSSSLASSTTITATPTGAAVVECTGFTYSVTSGTQYWVVIKNAAAVPETNNFTVKRYTGVRNEFSTGNTMLGNSYATTTDGGTTWSVTGNALQCVVVYSDSSAQGFLAINNSFSGGAYGSGGTRRHEGVYMVTPGDVKMRVSGFFLYILKNGTPTGSLTAKLRVGGSTYTATNVLAPGQAFGTTPFYLPSVVEIPPSTEIRITFENDAADSSSNCYRTAYYIAEDTVSNKSVIPLSLQYTLSSDDGSTWTETDEYLPSPSGLILDSDQFGASASSGGGAYVY